MVNNNFAPRAAAFLIAAIAAATLAGAWFFQLVIGLAPCPLCLDQRIPYYIALPLALIVASLAGQRAVTRAGFALLAIVFAVACGLGVYHVGVEWHWWAGPSDCSGGVPV